MKKALLFLACCLMALTIQAQKEHLKFMGIPLNGTIAQFQSKLAAKGVAYDNRGSQNIPIGCRAFTGTFSGEKAFIYVYYNSKTKIVYRAKAVIIDTDKDRIERKLNDYKMSILRKYDDGGGENYEQEGHPAYTHYVPDEDDNLVGTIGLYISNPTHSYDDDWALHVDYTDYINSEANESKNMDDL